DQREWAMSARGMSSMKPLGVVLAVVVYVGAGFSRPDLAAQGRGGGGGRGGGAPAPQGRVGAPVDLTGTWVSVVTEDWQWRMRTAPKGDTTSVPLNGEGSRVANTWDPSMDGRCEAYGVGGLMRMPGRLKISWQDDMPLKIASDAGKHARWLTFES